ncbi:MAG: alpha/beta hydrolase family protein [Vulcanimicrobiaceae bacterium]
MLMPMPSVVAVAHVGALPRRPPNGTYVYTLAQNGVTLAKSTISISSTAGAISVGENIRGVVNAVAKTTYDAATLHEKAYAATFRLAHGSQPTTVRLKAGIATVHVPGQTVKIHALPAAPLLLLGDNLVGTNLFIPAILAHTHTSAFTLAVLSGGRAMLARVVHGGPVAPPPFARRRDRHLAVDVAGLQLIYWYRPRSYIVDAVVVPAQGAIFALRSRSTGVQPVGTPAPRVTPVPTAQPHFESRSVRFTSADGAVLAGTLTVPDGVKGDVPAVVLVQGSGPMDRNETIGPNSVFLQLSNALSNAGYIVLRYDKRGIGRSGGSAIDATHRLLLADVKAAFAFVQRQPHVNAARVYLLGHSEGGLLVPEVAAKDRAVAGVILMAPPSLPLWKLSMQQAEAEGARPQAERRALAAIRAGKTTFEGSIWYRSEMDIDPRAAISKVRCPILIVQGADDLQVLPRDLPRLVDAARSHNPNVTVRIFSNDNHLFMPVTPGMPLTLRAEVRQYFSVAGRIDPRVVHTILAWLHRAATPAPKA